MKKITLSWQNTHLDDEKGAVIVYAVLILAIVTIIGISASQISTVELQTASNEQLHRIAFHNGDSGSFGTSKLISNMINISEPIDAGSDGAAGVQYLAESDTPSQECYDQVLGYIPYDSGELDVSFFPGGVNSKTDIRRLGTRNVSGGGTEFGSGTEGIGVGTASGGTAVHYNLDTEGFGTRSSYINISTGYRKVVGVPGGL